MNTVLMLHADVPLPVAAIARAAGLKYTPAASALATLERRGIAVRSSRAGLDEYAPNRDSVYYPMALGVALADLDLGDALAGLSILAVYAYGSLTQVGRSTRDSDLDLLIVGDVHDRDGLVQRLSIVGGRLGRTVDAFILTPEQLEAGRVQDDVHIAAALEGVRIFGHA